MKIYFAGAIRGGREQQPIYKAIVDHLQSQGHKILSAHVAAEDVDEEQGIMTDEEIYQRDIAWIRECDLMIADVTVPSLGVGYEIAIAEQQLRPVIHINQRGARVSAMIQGNLSLHNTAYENETDAITNLDALISCLDIEG